MSVNKNSICNLIIAISLVLVIININAVAAYSQESPPTPPPQPVWNPGSSNVSSDEIIEIPGTPYDQQDGKVPLDLGDRNAIHLNCGEFIHQVRDIYVESRGLHLEFIRTYRSNIDYNGPIGRNWTYNYNKFIKVYSGQVKFFDGDGRVYTFVENNNVYEESGGAALKLIEDNGTYMIELPHGKLYTFGDLDGDSMARIVEIGDRNENKLTFTYSIDDPEQLCTISDTLNREYTIEYHDTGRIMRITDYSGREWLYGYNNDDFLKKFKNPPTPDFTEGVQTTYKYNNDDLMLSMENEVGKRFQNTYDGNNWLVNHIRGSGSWTIQYASYANHFLATVVDRNGNKTDYSMVLPDRELEEVVKYMLRDCENDSINPDSPSSYTTTIQDNNGKKTYNYDDGRKYSELKDINNTNLFAQSNLLEERKIAVESSGEVDLVNRYIYEAKYQQIKKSYDPNNFPNGLQGTFDPEDPNYNSVITYIYDYEELNEPQTDINGDGVIGPDHGNVIKIIYPDVSTFGKYFEGSNPQTNVCVIKKYNTRGQILERKDEKGIRTKYYYWPANDPGGQEVTSEPISQYDVECGYLAKKVYDYSEDTQEIDPVTGKPRLNISRLYYYDTWGNLIRSVNGDGREIEKEFNSHNLVTRRVDGPNGIYESKFAYNANDCCISIQEKNVTCEGSVDTENPWFETYRYFNEIDMLEEVEREVVADIFISTKYCYDNNENTVLEISPLASSGEDASNVVSYVYDERDLIYSRTQGGWTDQFATLTAHDSIEFSELGITRDNDNQATAYFTYDVNKEVIESVDACGKELHCEQDGHGRISKERDGLGNETCFNYDLLGQVVTTQHYEGSETTGKLLNEELREYDERGRLIEINVPFFHWSGETKVTINADYDQDGIVTKSYSYDNKGKRVAFADDRGVSYTLVRDGLGRTVYKRISYTENDISEYEYEYNACGSITKSVNTEFDGEGSVVYTTENDYNIMNRRVERRNMNLGTCRKYYFGSRNLVEKTEDELGNITTKTHDGLGRLTKISREKREGGTGSGDLIGTVDIQYDYDSNGNTTSVIDGNENVTTYEYDSLNRMIESQIEGGSEPSVAMEYYKNGCVKKQTLQNGTIIEYSYNDSNGLSRKDITLGTGVNNQTTYEEFEWNALGNLKRAENDNIAVEFKHDSLSNKIYESFNGIFDVSKTCDWRGNCIALDYPSGYSCEYDYDAFNDIIDSIKIDNVERVGYSYTSDRRLIERNIATDASQNIKFECEYGAGKNIRSLKYTMNSSIIYGFEFGVTDSDNIKYVSSLHDNGVGSQFEYSSINELLKVKKGIPQEYLSDPQTSQYNSYTEYCYDLGFNNDYVDYDGNILDFTANDLNQYTNVGQQALDYDLNGNLISGGLYTYTYDYNNRLVEVNKTGVGCVLKYYYDPMGRRVKIEKPGVTVYEIWSGNKVIERRENDGQGTEIYQYVYGRGIDNILMIVNDTDEVYLLKDDKNSTGMVIDGNGNQVEKYIYDEYGKTLVYNNNDELIDNTMCGNVSFFCGRDYDSDCKIYYNRSRYYCPSLGRFLNRDPIGINGGINIYAYANNNPVNLSDPFGTEPTNWRNWKGYDQLKNDSIVRQIEG